MSEKNIFSVMSCHMSFLFVQLENPVQKNVNGKLLAIVYSQIRQWHQLSGSI